MKSKVILFCVLLFCSKIVDSIPHSENHVRQTVNPLSNWQNNKNVPNSAVQQENNEDNYSNQRGYNYDSYGYNKGPASSSSAKELLVNYDSPADGRRLDFYPPRVESYPSHTSQVGFNHQQYRNEKWRSQNPLTDVPSSVFIPIDEKPLLTSVQEPYRGLAQNIQPKYVPSSNRRFYQPERSYLTREQLQHPSVDHSGVNKYVVKQATRFGSRGLIPYENYSESQASETKTRPTGAHRHGHKFETPSDINYETPVVKSPDTLVDQSENIRYPVPYENYREGQVSDTKTRLTGVRRYVQDFETPSKIDYETPAVESPDTLVDQFENIRYPVPYENYREGQASETKTRPTGVRRHVQKFETPSDINYETPVVKSPDSFVDQSENIRYPVPYENYREGQVSETKTRLTGVRSYVQDFETSPEINYETPAVESPDTLVDQSENIRYPVPYENYRQGQVSETKTRLTGVRRYVHDFETPSKIDYETPAVESPDTDNYSSDSRPSNLGTVLNVKKDATVDTLARQYAHRSDYGRNNVARDNSNNEVPTDIIETVEVKEGKYGATYAEEKTVPINTYLEDSLTPINKVLENSGSYTYEESNVPQYGSSSPNNSKQNAIHHLTSEIKELSLKSLVANPEIQHILSRTDKRYVVVHSNGTIEYLDTLPLDSQQESKLRLVHTKRKKVYGLEGDEVLTPKLPQNLSSNNAKSPAPVDEYQWPTNNQPVDEYHSNRVIPFENLPTGHSHLKPLLPHAEQPADNENSKPLLPPVNQSADGGYSKPLIPNEGQPVDDSNSNQPKDDDNLKSLAPNEAQPAYDANPKPTPENLSENDDNLNPLSHDVNLPTDDDIIKHWTSSENQSRDDDSPKPLLTDVNHSNDKINLTPYARNPVHVKRHKHAFVTHPANDNTFKPLLSKEAQPSDDSVIVEPSHVILQPAHDSKPKYSHGNQPENDDNYTKPSSPVVNQPADDEKSEPFNENPSGDDIILNLLNPHYRQHEKSKHSHVNKPADQNNLNPSSSLEPLDYPKNQPRDDNPAKSLPSHDNQSGDNKKTKPSDTNENQTSADNDPEPLLPHKRHPAHRHKPKQKYGNQHEDDDNLNSANRSVPLPHKKNPAYVHKSKKIYGNQHEDDDNSNSALENQPAEDKTSKPLPTNENEISPYKQTGDDDQLGDETGSTLSLSHKKHQGYLEKLKHPHVDLESEDNNANPLSQDENQQRDDKADENQSGDEIVTTPLPQHKKQQVHHKKTNHLRVNKSADDNNSKTSPEEAQTEDDKKSKSLPTSENQSTDDNNSKPSPPEKNLPENDIKSKPTPSVSSKKDDESSTLSPTVPSYTKTPKSQAKKRNKRRRSHRKTTTNSPVVSITPSPDNSSEDQIIKLSPIEQVTDNVSDVPTFTTATAKPVETPDKQDTFKDANNKPDEAYHDTNSSTEDLASISDKVQTSTTTATPSSSASPTDNASDDKTKGKSEENENKAVVSKDNNGKDNTQTAEYNSSELLDTNTDVPEEIDDYSPVTPSPSVLNDVDTGDASGDNSSELEQSETDVTITVSSSTTFDAEDEIITINIEVLESTDDADSPSNDKTLVVSIDTNPDNDDDSKALQTGVFKTTKTEDCKEDHNHDDGRSKNVEIDLSNLKGEPIMWIKTSNQDFIDQLTAKNDTQFDVVYFFSIENQPTIEREKETTIFCNGTVVIETTEILYAHKDDSTPTIVKTTEIMQIEDYELSKI